MTQYKKGFLEKEGLLNPRPERVTHPLFLSLSSIDKIWSGRLFSMRGTLVWPIMDFVLRDAGSF